MNSLNILLTFVGGNASVLAVVSYIGRKWVESRLKAVEHRNHEQLEQLKSELAQAQYKHSIMFEKTAQLTVESFRLLLHYRKAVQSFVNTCTASVDSPSIETERSKVTKASYDFHYHLADNHIYMTKDPLDKLWELAQIFEHLSLQAGLHFRIVCSGTFSQTDMEKRLDYMEKMENGIPEKIRELRDAIRNDLGIVRPQ